MRERSAVTFNAGATFGVLIAALAAPACSIDLHGQAEVVREERRFQAADGVELVLRTFDGAIDLQSWDQDEVVVRIERTGSTTQEAEALPVRATQEGNRILIEASEPEDRGDAVRIGPGRSVAFVVRAPRRTRIEARSGDGSITASGFDGAIALETGDGSVRGERLGGQVRVRTGDGSISLMDAQGAVDLNTGDGSIDLRGRLESLRVHSGDGSVHVAAEDGSAVAREWLVTTGDGAIRVELPAGLDANVEADSGDGRVSADWAEPSRRDDGDRQSFRGRLGKGGPAIRLESGDGSIDIRSRR